MAATPTRDDVRALLELDRVIHEPARLVILTILDSADEVEFKFLESVTGMTKGNLSSHVTKLEEAGYLTVTKAFRGKRPLTSYRLTDPGRAALHAYRRALASLGS
jgi:DNA-binding transcriptional ArsR family regulator